MPYDFSKKVDTPTKLDLGDKFFHVDTRIEVKTVTLPGIANAFEIKESTKDLFENGYRISFIYFITEEVSPDTYKIVDTVINLVEDSRKKVVANYELAKDEAGYYFKTPDGEKIALPKEMLIRPELNS